MSTTDPHLARRDLDGGRRAGGLLALVLTGLLLLAAGGAAGYAVAAFFDTFRDMNINSVFSDAESSMLLGWGAPVAVVGSLVAFGLHGNARRAWFGSGGENRGIGQGTVWGLGMVAVLWWATLTQWVRPDQVGVAVDPTFGQDEAWGVGEWIWYTMQWWLPGLITLVVLYNALPVRRTAEDRRRAAVARLLTTGRRVPGEVTHVQGMAAQPGTYSILKWTFRFTDLQGQQRWVERTETFPSVAVPRVGDTVQVLFDAEHPGDRKQIFAALGDGEKAEEYVRKSVG
ncbi:DUF3592 domain-containing protein [Isoptericola sp. F-RaC21]|uniref:DUF3592 domain-containing protein n=1 Tax=Isoptericola sp. F-RaC21 TaxID=3141452 RepID=UPI00315B6A32